MSQPSSAGSSELLPLCKTLGSEKGSRQSQAWWRRCGEGGESKKNDARGGKGRRERKKIVAEDGGGSLHWRCHDETAAVKPWEAIGPWVIMLMMMVVMLRSVMKMIVLMMEGVP